MAGEESHGEFGGGGGEQWWLRWYITIHFLFHPIMTTMDNDDMMTTMDNDEDIRDDNNDDNDEDVQRQQGRLFFRWRGRRAMAAEVVTLQSTFYSIQ